MVNQYSDGVSRCFHARMGMDFFIVTYCKGITCIIGVYDIWRKLIF